MTAPNIPLLGTEPDEELHSLGAIKVRVGERPAWLPLKDVAIRAEVADRLAQIAVTETFHNPYGEPLEAVYIFPLTGGCAVSACDLKIGDRTVRGILSERGEARRNYQEALEQGKRAALFEQERDDVFTIQVGNIAPGEEIAVHLTCSQELPYYQSGATELRLPLVVAPRYIPGEPVDGEPTGSGIEPDTTEVPDASRITPPRLADGLDAGVRLHLEVILRDGSVADLTCSQHATRNEFGPEGISVALAHEAEIMNRDFILRWRAAAKTMTSRFLVHRSADGTWGRLSIVPPAGNEIATPPRDVVFVLDRSGSMSGPKMASAARACAILLGTLGPLDRFGILDFDTMNEWFDPGDGARIVPATPEKVTRGASFLRQITPGGGTEIGGALIEALHVLHAAPAPAGRVPVIVLVTDGEVGAETQLLKAVATHRKSARVFTVGVDTALNDSLLKKLAKQSGGTCTCVTPGDALESALEAISREIGAPLLTDLALEFPGADPAALELSPSRLPDLFAGRPVTVFVRLDAPRDVRIRGRLANGHQIDELVRAEVVTMPALVHLWARSRVTDLEDHYRMEPADADEVRRRIIELSIRHAVLSRFTAFVAVDEEEIVNADGTRRTVTQPVPMPAEWDTTGFFDAGQPVHIACSSAVLDRLNRLQYEPRLCHVTEDRRALRFFRKKYGAAPESPKTATTPLDEVARNLEELIIAMNAPVDAAAYSGGIARICKRTWKLIRSNKLSKQLPVTLQLLTRVEDILKKRLDLAELRREFLALNSLVVAAVEEVNTEAGHAPSPRKPFWGKTV